MKIIIALLSVFILIHCGDESDSLTNAGNNSDTMIVRDTTSYTDTIFNENSIIIKTTIDSTVVFDTMYLVQDSIINDTNIFIDTTTVKDTSQHLDTLYISDGTPFIAPNFYPTFSWETTPMYYMFGQGYGVLDEDQRAFISDKSEFICIEKNHAASELGYAELGTKYEVPAFKALKPESKVLYYFNAAYAWTFTSYNEHFVRDELPDYPTLMSYLLYDDVGDSLYHRNDVFYFDVLNEDFRTWWVESVSDAVQKTGADGVFVDQMHGFAWLRWDVHEEVATEMGNMMSDLKAAIGADKILLGNNAANVSEVFPSVDAVMFEHYNADLINKEGLLKDWEDMLRIAQAGKMSIFRIGAEIEAETEGLLDDLTVDRNDFLETYSQEKEEFFLACFLIGAQPYSYFQYGWGFSVQHGATVEYPETQKSLGKPLGAYTRVSESAWEFTREFENASVWVDTENRESKITWK